MGRGFSRVGLERGNKKETLKVSWKSIEVKLGYRDSNPN